MQVSAGLLQRDESQSEADSPLPIERQQHLSTGFLCHHEHLIRHGVDFGVAPDSALQSDANAEVRTILGGSNNNLLLQWRCCVAHAMVPMVVSCSSPFFQIQICNGKTMQGAV